MPGVPPRSTRKRKNEDPLPTGKVGAPRTHAKAAAADDAGAGAGAGAGVGVANRGADSGAMVLTERQNSMTVEAYLRETCDSLVKSVISNAETQTTKLRAEYSQYKRALTEALAEKHADSAKATAVDAVVDVHLEVAAGPYKGKTFVVKPRAKKICKLGRSTGRTFTRGGVSLPDDLEVSTTHGKFHLLDGVVHFTDMGSTNGTEMNGKPAEEGTPYPITSGDKVCCGATLMQVTLVTVDK